MLKGSRKHIVKNPGNAAAGLGGAGTWDETLTEGNNSGANDAVFDKLGVAASTVTQKGSQSLKIQNSLWTGAAESVTYYNIKSVASTTVNQVSRLAIDYEGAELVSILNNGNFGIGIAIPTAKLHVYAGGGYFELATNDFVIDTTAQANLFKAHGSTSHISITSAATTALDIIASGTQGLLVTNLSGIGVYSTTSTTRAILAVVNTSGIGVETFGGGAGMTHFNVRMGGSGQKIMQLVNTGTAVDNKGFIIDFSTQALATNNTQDLHVWSRGSSGAGNYTGDHFKITDGVNDTGNALHVTGKNTFDLGVKNLIVNSTGLANLLYVSGVTSNITMGSVTDGGATLFVDNTDDSINLYGARFRSVSTIAGRPTVKMENSVNGTVLDIDGTAVNDVVQITGTAGTINAVLRVTAASSGGIIVSANGVGKAAISSDALASGAIALDLVNQGGSGTLIRFRPIGTGATFMDLSAMAVNDQTFKVMDMNVTTTLTASNTNTLYSLVRGSAGAGHFTGTHFKIQDAVDDTGLALNVIGSSTFDLGVKNYRINTTGQADLFHVDGANIRIGIGTGSPSKQFHIVNGAGSLPSLNASTQMILQNNSAVGDNVWFTILSGNTGVGQINFADAQSETSATIRYNHNVNKLFIDGNSPNGIVLDAVGNVCIGGQNPGSRLEVYEDKEVTANVTDGYAGTVTLNPAYNANNAASYTITRHNYMDVNNVTAVNSGAGNLTVTDAALFRLDAALGTHLVTTNVDKSGNVASGTLKVNVNGTIKHIQLYDN